MDFKAVDACKKKYDHIYTMDTPADHRIVEDMRKDWSIILPVQASEDQIIASLSVEVNRLIIQDFQRLVGLLYRIDISEANLKKLLRDNRESEAGRIIAWMILERQKEKIRSREQSRKDPSDIPEDDRW
jgi:hypothetical protein